AREGFLAAVAQDEADPESRRRMTVALLQTGHLADAERWARGSVALHPDEATHFLLGAILHSSGKSAEAIEQLERVLTLNPDNLDAIGLLGWCKYEIEEFNAADQLLERAIAADARRPGLWTTLG